MTSIDPRDKNQNATFIVEEMSRRAGFGIEGDLTTALHLLWKSATLYT
jgi:hypothetical protein